MNVKRLREDDVDRFTRYRSDAQFFRAMAEHMDAMSSSPETAGKEFVAIRIKMRGWAEGMKFAAGYMDLKTAGALPGTESPELLANAMIDYMKNISDAANRAAEAAVKMMGSRDGEKDSSV